jgi:hypothetical protein
VRLHSFAPYFCESVPVCVAFVLRAWRKASCEDYRRRQPPWRMRVRGILIRETFQRTTTRTVSSERTHERTDGAVRAGGAPLERVRIPNTSPGNTIVLSPHATSRVRWTPQLNRQRSERRRRAYPGSQSMHSASPVFGLCVPAEQLVQNKAPRLPMNLPRAHAGHCTVPFFSVACPMSQRVQFVWPRFGASEP